MHPDNASFQMFRNTSDSDSTNLVVAGAANFDVIGPAGKKNFHVERVCMTLIDGSIQASTFGGIAALTNGCQFLVLDDNGTQRADLTPQPIKHNGHWALLAGVDAKATFAAGDDAFPIRWTLSRGLGSPLELPTGWILRFAIRDALTGLTSFQAMAQGYLQ